MWLVIYKVTTAKFQKFTNNLASKISKAIDMFPNRVGPLTLIPLISPQMADNLKVSKY